MELTKLCHNKAKQIGETVGLVVETEKGRKAIVYALGRVEWLEPDGDHLCGLTQDMEGNCLICGKPSATF